MMSQVTNSSSIFFYKIRNNISFSCLHQGTWVKPDFGSTESNRNSNNVPRPQKRSDTRDKLNICVYGKEDLLLHSCQPKSVADLVVQKKKIDEVRHWLSEAYSASRTGVSMKTYTSSIHILKLYFTTQIQ